MRRRAVRLLAVTATGALAVAAAPSPVPPAFERPIEVAAPGRVFVRLDRDVYEAARADLGDLRVSDERGRDVPYVIDRAEPLGLPEARPAIRNRGWSADGAATAVLDFGRRLGKRRLQLRLSGDNFRRRVAVEGGDDGAAWVTLVDEAWVFAVPGPEPARYETVDLPENDFPLLRVVAHPAPDEKGRPAIEDAWVPGDGRPPRGEERLVARWSEAQDAEGPRDVAHARPGRAAPAVPRGRARRRGRALLPRGARRGPARPADPGGAAVVGGDRPRRALPAGARGAAPRVPAHRGPRPRAGPARPRAQPGRPSAAGARGRRARAGGAPAVRGGAARSAIGSPTARPTGRRLPTISRARRGTSSRGAKRHARPVSARPGGWRPPGRTTAPGRSATRRSCGAASSRSSWRWGR